MSTCCEEAIALAKRRMLGQRAATTTAIQQRTQDELAKGFASTGDMAEKKITFSEIGTDIYAFTAEGDPNYGGHRRRRRLPRVRRAGDAGDGQQGDRAGRDRHRQADQICRAVALSRRARARRLRLQGAGHRRLAGNPSADRGARPAGLGFRIWPLSAPVPGCREHSRPDLADADLRRAR